MPTSDDIDRSIWRSLGYNNQMKKVVEDVIWPALIDGKTVTILVDGERAAELPVVRLA